MWWACCEGSFGSSPNSGQVSHRLWWAGRGQLFPEPKGWARMKEAAGKGLSPCQLVDFEKFIGDKVTCHKNAGK